MRQSSWLRGTSRTVWSRDPSEAMNVRSKLKNLRPLPRGRRLAIGCWFLPSDPTLTIDWRTAQRARDS